MIGHPEASGQTPDDPAAASGAADAVTADIVAAWQTIVDGTVRTQQSALSRVEETGLPGVWFEALYTLSHADGHRLPMNRLAQSLLMTAGGFTKLADRMARAGLIDRRNSEGDRRVVYAALTEEGLRQAAAGEQVYRDALEHSVLGILDADTVRHVTDAMNRLRVTHRPIAPLEPEMQAAERDPTLPDRRRGDA